MPWFCDGSFLKNGRYTKEFLNIYAEKMTNIV